MNQLLKQISDHACDDLAKLIEEGNDDILAAIHKAEEEAQLQETSPKFSLGFKITADLDKSTFDCQLSWSLKQVLCVSHQIEDPNQGKLPIDGVAAVAEAASKLCPRPGSGIDSVTISTGNTSVTLGPEHAAKLKRAARKLRGK